MIPASIITRALPYVAVAATAFAGAWQWQANKYGIQLATLRAGHADTLQQLADKAQAATQAVREREGQIQAAIAAADQQHQQELTHAKTDTDRLRACVRAGTCGVRIIAQPAQCVGSGGRPEDAATGSVGNAAGALDAGFQQRVLDLRDAIAADSAALSYLQAYARQCAGLVE